MGPLTGVKIIEIAGVGPGPFCGMLLSDLGADIIRVDRKGMPAASSAALGDIKYDVTSRGRRSIALDLKNPAAVDTCLRLVDKSDILFEGFRPGVMERLGLGPDICLQRNPKLVYGRMTGWGQTGPLANAAGHDINYIALTGALEAIGPAESPVPPLNLVGDFGGGALYLALGMIAALFEANRSGSGQIVDAAMTEGAASLATMFYGMHAAGAWKLNRAENMLDGAAPFYDVYETSDKRFIALGSVEAKFYALLRHQLGLEDAMFDRQMDQSAWPAQKEIIAEAISKKTQEEWCKIMEGTDICFAPVLTFEEAPNHPHNVARESFVVIDGVTQPNVAPKFSRTPSEVQGSPPEIGQHTVSALLDWGFTESDINRLEEVDAI